MHKHRAIAAAYVILERDDHYLLLRRKNTGFLDGELALPAGHVDSGESVITGAIREAKEEIGITIAVEDLTLVHIMDRNAEDWHRIGFYFHCTKWEGEPVNCEPNKCAELKWVPKDEVKKEITTYLQQVFEKIEEPGTFYSVQGWE